MVRDLSLGTLAAVAIAVGVAAGCGGGSSQSSDSTAAAKAAKPPAPKSAESTSAADEASGSGTEPSKEFIGKGPNGKLAKAGKESTVAERTAASRVLDEYFDAREAGDWKGQCALLAASTAEEIAKAVFPAGSANCANALESQAKGIPASLRVNTMVGPIDALRVNQGINGFAFYHGTGGKDYVIPMIKQEGWKVVALTTQEAP